MEHRTRRPVASARPRRKTRDRADERETRRAAQAEEEGGAAATLERALALASLGNRTYSVAVVVAIYATSHSATLVAAAAAVRYLAGLGASVFALRLTSRFGPRRMLLASNLACFGVALGLAALARTSGSAAGIIVLAGLLRALTAPVPVATAELLPPLLGARDLAEVRRRQNAIDKLSLLLGPGLGGVMLLVVSAPTELFIISWLFALGVAVALRVPPPVSNRWATVADELGDEPSAPQHRRRGQAALRWFASSTIAAGLLYGLDAVLFAVIASDRLHLASAGYGLLFAGLGAGGAAAALFTRRVTRCRNVAAWIVACLCLYALPTAAMPWVSNIGVALVIEAVRGFGALLAEVLAVTGLQSVLLPTEVPRVVARVGAGVAGAVAGGALLTPVLLSAFGLRTTLLVAALAVPLAAVLVLPAVTRVDRTRRARAHELAPRARVLADLGLLRGVSMPTIELLAAGLRELRLPAGAVIVAEGEVSDALYVVVEGSAGATAADGSLLSEMGVGQWFGEIAALTGSPRTATVTTTAPARLFEISAALFREALSQLPPSSTLLDSAAARLRLTHPTRNLLPAGE